MSGRPFTIVGAVVAVVALAAFVLIGTQLGKSAGAVGGGGVTTVNRSVVVAAKDLTLRAPITLDELQVIRMPAASIPPGAFDKPDPLLGLIPVVSVFKGQAVTSNVVARSSDQISPAGAAFLPIPKGYVAVTIPTAEQQGVAGYIQPGDYITITAIVKVKNRDTLNVRTIYTNVHVIRLGTISDQLTAPNGQQAGTSKAQSASSLTIVVTQCQAEYLNWFIANEQIKYTLESYNDYAPKDSSVDSTCPTVDSARGVTEQDIVNRWPGINA